MKLPGHSQQLPQCRRGDLAELPRRHPPQGRVVKFHGHGSAVVDLGEPPEQVVGGRAALARQDPIRVSGHLAGQVDDVGKLHVGEVVA